MEASARAPEDLYGLPLEEFTPARDALARELRAAGRRDEAADVKGLRKPTVAAWSLNRAARHHPDAVERLRAAGADLRAAQDEALAGDAGRLRDAGRALAEEVDRVAALAADGLRSAGRPVSATQQERLVSTLRTAAVDEAAGDALARGVLVDELDPTGFTLVSGRDALSAPPAPPAKKPKPSTEALEAVEAATRELRRCDAEAETAATRARRRAERAEVVAGRAAEAQREAEEARTAAEEAAGEAEAARRAAAEAAARLARAVAALPS